MEWRYIPSDLVGKFMKRSLVIASIVVAVGFVAPQAQAKNACESYLCMAGEVMGGSGGSACSSSIKDFFSIVVFGSTGQMLTGHTADKRRDFLNQCGSADPSIVSKIISKYGRTLGL